MIFVGAADSTIAGRLGRLGRLGLALALVVAPTVVGACGAGGGIGALTPRPKVTDSYSAHFQIDAQVEDSFETPTRGRAKRVSVRRWRTTLARGFQSTVAARSGPSSTTVTLQLLKAELSLVSRRLIEREQQSNAALAFVGDSSELPTLLAHAPHGSHTASPRRRQAVYARISYSAVLRDRSGRELASTEGVAISREPTDLSVTLSDAVRSAVEVMYESMLPALFSGPP